MLARIGNVLDTGQAALIYVAARFGPLATGVGPAFFVYRALSKLDGVPPWVAILLGISMEFVALAASTLVLRMMKWQRIRAQKDDAAPIILAWAAVALYGAAGVFITVALEFFTFYGPKFVGGLFVFLNLASFGVLALNIDQARREQEREQRLAEAAKARKEKKSTPKVKAPEPAPVLVGTPKERTLAVLETEGDMTVRQLAKRANVSVGTAANWLREWRKTESYLKS